MQWFWAVCQGDPGGEGGVRVVRPEEWPLEPPLDDIAHESDPEAEEETDEPEAVTDLDCLSPGGGDEVLWS